MDNWHRLWKAACGLYLAAFTKGIRVEGSEHIRPGPKIVISNHPTVTAMFAPPFVFPDKLCYLIQADAFDFPLVGGALRRAGHIPVTRGQRAATLGAAHERLKQGYAVLIYPEGRLSPAETFAPPRVGAALLALESGAPVVPVGCFTPPRFVRRFRFHYQGQERNGVLQFGGKCFIRVGPAWQPPRPPEADRSDHGLRSLAEMLMEKVVALVEQAQASAGERG